MLATLRQGFWKYAYGGWLRASARRPILQVAHWARLKWEGVDLQELLGHANIFITLNTYSHVLPGMVEQTAIVMENVLS